MRSQRQRESLRWTSAVSILRYNTQHPLAPLLFPLFHNHPSTPNTLVLVTNW